MTYRRLQAGELSLQPTPAFVGWERDMQRATAIGIAILRISMGLLFLGHVGIRLTIVTWPVALQFFASLGLPWFVAYAVTATELIAGILLIIGWQVRVAALAGMIVLLGATFLVHIERGFLFTNAGGGWEYPAFWAVALFCQSLFGAGAWAVGEMGTRTKTARP